MTSILLTLRGRSREHWIVDMTVSLARRHAARIRAVTIADERRVAALAIGCEAAHQLVEEQTRLHLLRQAHATAQAGFATSCLAAGVDFDVRRHSGDPLEILCSEAPWHDLVVAPLSESRDEDAEPPLSARQLIELVRRTEVPVLIPRRPAEGPQRVLLVHDGTPDSNRLLRDFVRHPLFDEARHRVLTVGRTERAARDAARNVADYCRVARFETESGWVVGSLRNLLVPYASKWEADVVLLGAPRGNSLLRRFLGDTAQDVLLQTGCGVYLAG